MTLSEKLYTLRKKSGLSQEELADSLNVSRQAISKWESGNAIPEKDNLIAISEYFSVSIDYLLKDYELPFDNSDKKDKPYLSSSSSKQSIMGIAAVIIGFIGLIIWISLSILNPNVSDKISGSSMITIDGNGILLLICATVIIIGGIFLLKRK